MHLDEVVEFLNLNEFFNFLTHFQTPISTPSEIESICRRQCFMVETMQFYVEYGKFRRCIVEHFLLFSQCCPKLKVFADDNVNLMLIEFESICRRQCLPYTNQFYIEYRNKSLMEI